MANLKSGIAVAAGAAALAIACGARGPHDLSPDYNDLVDASSLVDVSSQDAASMGDVATPADAAADAPASPIQCATCVGTKCGSQLQMCITSTSCRNILQCVVQKCAGGGGMLNPACLLQCAGGDTTGIVQAVAVVQCITGQCGAACLGVLPGTGGMGGGATMPPDVPVVPPSVLCAESSCPE